MQSLDLTYADRSDRNRLDVFVPEGVVNPPLVVFIHGGAFRMGDKGFVGYEDKAVKPALLAAGFAVASINYRYSSQAIWPAQLDDLRDAFAYLRAQAGRFGYDAGRMASFGPSAGGYYSAMAGIVLAGEAGTRLRASVVWYPPIEFTTMDADMEAVGTPRASGRNDALGSPESELIGAVVADHPALAAAASPLTYLAGLARGTPLPAFLIMHGARDPLISHLQSERLARGLATHGTCPRLEVQVLPQGTHGGGSFLEPAAMATVVQFLDEVFQA